MGLRPATRKAANMTNDPIFILLAIAMIAVLVILGMGIAQFGKGTKEAAKKSNKFMQLRIAAQAVAVVLLLIFVWMRSGG